MTTRQRSAGALAGLAVLLTACGSGTDDTAEPGAPTVAVPTAARPVVDDLAAQGVPLAEVEDVRVEEVTWSDASLGCAEPGQTYAETTVDGLRLTVVTAEETYEYHQGGEDDPFLCERPSE